ncbi:MAG: hypothetical protein NTX06_02440 [Proteobacteria bacterium]|nr:hypothetical protein [Pseudomonadota bacterium]
MSVWPATPQFVLLMVWPTMGAFAYLNEQRTKLLIDRHCLYPSIRFTSYSPEP